MFTHYEVWQLSKENECIKTVYLKIIQKPHDPLRNSSLGHQHSDSSDFSIHRSSSGKLWSEYSTVPSSRPLGSLQATENAFLLILGNKKSRRVINQTSTTAVVTPRSLWTSKTGSHWTRCDRARCRGGESKFVRCRNALCWPFFEVYRVLRGSRSG